MAGCRKKARERHHRLDHRFPRGRHGGPARRWGSGSSVSDMSLLHTCAYYCAPRACTRNPTKTRAASPFGVLRWSAAGELTPQEMEGGVERSGADSRKDQIANILVGRGAGWRGGKATNQGSERGGFIAPGQSHVRWCLLLDSGVPSVATVRWRRMQSTAA